MSADPKTRPLTPAEETDARLAAGEDIAQAAELDAEVHRLRAAGDPSVRFEPRRSPDVAGP